MSSGILTRRSGIIGPRWAEFLPVATGISLYLELVSRFRFIKKRDYILRFRDVSLPFLFLHVACPSFGLFACTETGLYAGREQLLDLPCTSLGVVFVPFYYTSLQIGTVQSFRIVLGGISSFCPFLVDINHYLIIFLFFL